MEYMFINVAGLSSAKDLSEQLISRATVNNYFLAL